MLLLTPWLLQLWLRKEVLSTCFVSSFDARPETYLNGKQCLKPALRDCVLKPGECHRHGNKALFNACLIPI